MNQPVKNKLSKYFVFVSVFTLLCLFSFIVFKSYDNLINPIKQAQSSQLVKPVPTGFDLSVFDLIKQKQDFSSSDLVSTPTPDSTSSASPTP